MKKSGRIPTGNGEMITKKKNQYSFPGEVRMFHTFGGLIPIPRGWMKLDGSVVNKTSYDALHGAGTFEQDKINSSLFLNRNLPNSLNKFPVGKTGTTQNGTVPHTYFGNANNSKSMAHTHTLNDHIHQWHQPARGDSKSFDEDGNAYAISEGGSGTPFLGVHSNTARDQVQAHLYTDQYKRDSDGNPIQTSNGTITTQNIQPRSFDVIYIIKIK
jgi:hypothetical protein